MRPFGARQQLIDSHGELSKGATGTFGRCHPALSEGATQFRKVPPIFRAAIRRARTATIGQLDLRQNSPILSPACFRTSTSRALSEGATGHFRKVPPIFRAAIRRASNRYDRPTGTFGRCQPFFNCANPQSGHFRKVPPIFRAAIRRASNRYDRPTGTFGRCQPFFNCANPQSGLFSHKHEQCGRTQLPCRCCGQSAT